MLLRLLASRRRCPRGAYPPRAFSICHFCPPLRGRRRGGEGRRRTQCNASPTHGEKEEGERTRRREASYCGIIVVTTVAEEERRTPLTHSLPPAAAVSRKPGLDPPTRIFSSQWMRRAATPKNDATPPFENERGLPATPLPSTRARNGSIPIAVQAAAAAFYNSFGPWFMYESGLTSTTFGDIPSLRASDRNRNLVTYGQDQRKVGPGEHHSVTLPPFFGSGCKKGANNIKISRSIMTYIYRVTGQDGKTSR